MIVKGKMHDLVALNNLLEVRSVVHFRKVQQCWIMLLTLFAVAG